MTKPMPQGKFLIEIVHYLDDRMMPEHLLPVDVDQVAKASSNAKNWQAVTTSEPLLSWWLSSPDSQWFEFHRRYTQELQRQLELCELLRVAATQSGILLRYACGTHRRNPAIVLRDFLQALECQRRYQNGWIIGGYTNGVGNEILDRGGLYYQRHKVWCMPSAEDTHVVRSLLPGDF